jgi:hypothetical protein
MARYIVLKSSGSEFLKMLRTPFDVWYVKGNRCLLFILYSGMVNLSDEIELQNLQISLTTSRLSFDSKQFMTNIYNISQQ